MLRLRLRPRASSTLEKASAGYSGNGALKLVPALLISTCTLPSLASILRMQEPQ
jgi:hypothetical protein